MATTKITKYYPRCSVCKYMKGHTDFRRAVMRSTYFDPAGQESLMAVNERFGEPFRLPTLYRHMSRHQQADIERAERSAKLIGEPSKVWQRKTAQTAHKVEVREQTEASIAELLGNTEAVVEQDIVPRQAYEKALDNFIKVGEDKLIHGEMAISAANFVAAIKAKADIERSTKDRRMEMLKTMFVGAAPKQAGNGQG